MSTSGTVVYNVTESDIISDALESLGVYAAGATIASADTTFARRKLNMLLKNVSAASDMFIGGKVWLKKTGYLFLQTNQSQYSLGPSGDHATSSYAHTTLSASASSGASSVTVDSVTGFTSGYNIGIELDSGALQWTTLSGSPSGNSIPITATLTGDASAGNAVYCYQTKIQRPLRILTAVMRDIDNNDVPMSVTVLEDYEEIPAKYTDATPTALYFVPSLTNATMTLNSEPDDVSKVVRFVFYRPIEDMTTGTNDFDVPQEAYRWLSAQLQIDCAPAFGIEVGPTLKMIRDESLAIMRNAQPQEVNLYFQPGAD